MTTKTRSETTIEANGNLKAHEPAVRRMTGFQAKYMKRLIANFERAKSLVEQSQNAANEFIAACSEEEGITLGQDGWTFDIDALEFVKVPQPVSEGSTHGDNR